MVPGQRLGRYVVERKIGDGGMGTVYAAHDPKRGIEVAIKSIRPDLLGHPDMRRRFRQEAEIALSVVHPFIATVLDSISVGDQDYLVMEYVRGTPLASALKEGRMRFADGIRVVSELTEAVGAIHQKNLIHRDIKPGNVVLTETGHVKLLDLGLACPLAQRETTLERTASMDGAPRPRGAVGTLSYMSPEQIRGAAVDRRSDLFSLGVVLWEVATGRHPFLRDTPEQTKSAILLDAPHEEGRHEDRGRLARLIPVAKRALSKEPEQRFETAEQMLDAIREVAETSRPPPSRRLAWLAAAAVLLAALAAGTWLGTRPTATTDPVSVLIVPRVVAAEGDDAAAAARALGARIAAQLAAYPGIEPLDPERGVELALATGGDARSERLRASAAPLSPDRIVTTSVIEDADGVTAVLRIIDARETVEDRTISVRSASIGSTILGLVQQAAAVIAPASAGHEPDLDVWGDQDVSDEILVRTEVARQRLDELRLREALGSLESVLQEAPDYVRARHLYGLALQGSGQVVRAAAELERAQRDMRLRGAAEDGLSLTRLRADLARARSDESEVELRRQIVEQSARTPTRRLDLAVALERHGRSEEALPIFTELAEQSEFTVGASLGAYESLLSVGRLEEAATYVDRVEAYYRQVDVPAGRARVHEARGRIARAAKDLAEARRRFEQGAAEYEAAGLTVHVLFCRRHLAYLDLLEGKTEEAVEELSGLADAFRESGNLAERAKIHAHLGAALFQALRFDEAERQLRDAVNLAGVLGNDALRATPSLNLASLLVYRGRGDDAEALLRSALPGITRGGTPAQASTARVLLAAVLFQKGDFEVARETYSEVIEVGATRGDPGGQAVWAWAGRSEAEEALGLLGPAKSSARQSIALAVESGNKVKIGFALLRLGRVQAEIGAFAEARDTLDRIEREMGDSLARMEDLLARVRLVRGIVELESGAGLEAGKELLESAARAGKESGAERLAAPAYSALSRWARIEGAGELARAWAAEALRVPQANGIDRLEARIVAAASAPAGPSPDEEAMDAYHDAERSGARLSILEAAATIARGSGRNDPAIQPVMARAGLAAAEILDSMDDVDRAHFTSRPRMRSDLREIGFRIDRDDS